MYVKLSPLLAIFILAGCAAKKDIAQAPAAAPTTTPEERIAQDLAPQQSQEQIIEKVVQAKDPIAIFRPQVNLTVFRLTVPMGTVSRNEDFRKRVEQPAVDGLRDDGPS